MVRATIYQSPENPILNFRALIFLLIFHQVLYVTPVWCKEVNSEAGVNTIRIGVLAFRGIEKAHSRWDSIAAYLTKKIPEYRFIIHAYDLEGMDQAVVGRTVNFVLTNPGNYVHLESRFGVTRIATLSNRYKGQTYTVYGASILVRADRAEIRTLEDLKGRSFMAVSDQAFGGFQMAWRELHDHGINPYRDFSRLEFSGFPQDKIVLAVLDGKVDAGTVRSETLIRMADERKIELGDVRILNQKSDKRYPFPHSTRLYPGWAFAKLQHTSDLLAQKILVALLVSSPEYSDPESGYRHKWTIPLDYSPVHETFRVLKIGPYVESDRVSLIKVLRQYRYWIVIGIIFFLVLMASTVYVNRINQRLSLSRRELEAEVAERKQAQKALARHGEILEETVNQRTVELQSVNLELEQDIQTRKQVEEMLRINEVALRRLYEITSTSSMSFVEKVMALLKFATEHFHVDQGMVLNKQGTEYVCLYAWPDCDNRYMAATTNAMPLCYGMRFRLQEKNSGALCFIEIFPKPQMFSNLDLELMQLIGQWIAVEIGRLQAEEKVRQHQHELTHVSRLGTMGEMASGIAHELNQPLTAISNYTRGSINRLKEDNPEIDNIIDAIGLAAREADRAAEIIKRLRSFVKKGESVYEPFDINEALDMVVGIMSREISKHAVEVIVKPDNTLPEVYGDHIQVEQVMLNLLRNAIESVQAKNDKRKVEIKSWQESGKVFIDVRDNGSGINNKVREKLFHPFFTTKKEGMGLGLSISKSIIESHGGQLELVNTVVGEGSQFQLAIPIKRNG